MFLKNPTLAPRGSRGSPGLDPLCVYLNECPSGRGEAGDVSAVTIIIHIHMSLMSFAFRDDVKKKYEKVSFEMIFYIFVTENALEKLK